MGLNKVLAGEHGVTVSQARAEELLGGRDSRKVGHNTYMVWDADGCPALRYHNTHVATWLHDGSIRLTSGGWRTSTTKARFTWLGLSVVQDARVWYLHWGGLNCMAPKKEYVFKDGMVLDPGGQVTGAGENTEAAARAATKLKARVARYVRGYMDALKAGEVKAPSAGDCWPCSMTVDGGPDAGRPLGEVAFKDHLDHHMRERYYVPSLLARAVDVFGASVIARSYMHAKMVGQRSQAEGWENDVAVPQLASCLTRYMLRQHGLAA